jgi:nucleoside-diphosphate-sugar epimerase
MAKPPRIWLTGSRGSIGRPLVRALRRDQVDLTCFTQKVEGSNDLSGDAKLVHLDYLNPADIKDKVDHWGLPDIFIHLGWGSLKNLESPFHIEDNVQIGKTLIETLFKLGLKKFIFIGTALQYGGRVGLLSEDMEPQGSLTNYAKGKNEVERLGLQIAKEFGRIFISVRTFYVYGADQRQGSLVNDLVQAHLKGENVNLSPCEHYRDYIHVLDVVEGLRHICAIDQSTIVNLGSGKYFQVKDFVVNFWKKLGGDIDKLKFGMKTLRPGEPDQPKSYADSMRLIRLTQWQPQLSLQEGIVKTIEGLNNIEIHQGRGVNNVIGIKGDI